MAQTITLLILDGWGIGAKDYGNPVWSAKPKNIEYLKTSFSAGSLQASGIAVGLPWEEEGNSEVGHLTIGAGKVIYQHYPRITLAIERGDFFKNPALLGAFAHARQGGGAVHALGLLTSGNVHASLKHVEALLDLAAREQCAKFYLHLFGDGKDSPPRSVLELLERVRIMIGKYGVGKIASISGRYYAEDRDGHWTRTERACTTLIGKGITRGDIAAAVRGYYEKGLNDDSIEPFLIGPEPHPIRDNDALIFFDFREDSVRQIVAPFVLETFNAFPFARPENLHVTTFTNYSDEFPVPIAFPADKITNPLGKVLADNGKTQLRLAETEKKAHVTYFINGYREEPFANEYRVILPSRKVSRADEHPEMMTREISARIIESVSSGGFDLIIANFASSDMIAHTGNYDAALAAIGVIDEEVGAIARTTLEKGAILIITSDHGHIERMIDPLTGKPLTKHVASPVPFYLVGSGFERQKTILDAERADREPIGLLSDVAPTILALMGIPKPPEMTGQNLMPLLR